MSGSYAEDPLWVRPERRSRDDDGNPQFEKESCHDCDGRLWSDGREKVCEDCGYCPTVNGRASSASKPHPQRPKMGLLQYPNGSRLRYYHSKRVILQGAMGHPEDRKPYVHRPK